MTRHLRSLVALSAFALMLGSAPVRAGDDHGESRPSPSNSHPAATPADDFTPGNRMRPPPPTDAHDCDEPCPSGTPHPERCAHGPSSKKPCPPGGTRAMKR